MCIWACFTAFYRNGDINVSPLSAILMSVFFVLFGMTVGVYVTSFTLQKKKSLSVLLPSAIASIITLVMYIGEMILLNGNLYRFGQGPFFEGLPFIALAPVDILVILISGAFTGITSYCIRIRNI